MQDEAPPSGPMPERFTTWQRSLLTVLACALTTLLATPLLGYLDLANIVMLFLLTVLLLAVSLGRGAAVQAAVLSVLLFDIFFVPPRFSLAVSNIQYLVTFAVMLATALITGQLAAGLKQKAREAQVREQQTHALYEVARQLAGTLSLHQVLAIARQFVSRQFAADSTLLLPADHPPGSAETLAPSAFRVEPHLAAIALQGGETVRNNEFSSAGYASFYLPLRASLRTRGVLAVAFPANAPEVLPEQQALLEALASLIAIAIERLHYVEVAQATQLNIVAERLRSSILSALSHDLRTPLTALVGLADSLSLIKPALPTTALETAQAMHEQAARLAGLVGNLLDMARLNAGQVTLRREWQPLEEVIGASIKLLGSALATHPVRVTLPADLPLLQFDAVLIERVFCNLLENAAKYAPPATPIEIEASQSAEFVEVRVRDHGPGFPAGDRAALFDMFVRGQTAASKPGTGLGLAICRAIVEAHGGTIVADNAEDGGASLCFTLPRGVPPVVEEESA
ncbi:MAG: ATP-binding region, ATPase-like:Histidine kinase N-terminal [Proteobacteria bacterium]|nr:ATP-binding region, ATPase-like:Histidine kinase N-terminal [Pseudomonadota bacterium]